MSESDVGHIRLSEEQVAHLLRLPVGERVRELRTRLFKTQAPFRMAIKNLTKWEPSAAWLSGVENGSLPLTSERRDQVALALALHPDDWRLLDEDSSPTTTPEPLLRYAAWQSVRLALANELVRVPSKDADRARAREARDRLRDQLEADVEIYEASRKRVGQLSAFADLPDPTKWLLVIEASFMDPFLPWQPISRDWGASRKEALIAMAEELGLTSDRAQIEIIEKARKSDPVSRVKDREPKRSEPEPTGPLSAAESFWDPDDRARAIRGGEVVGALGWGFVGGIYLVRPIAQRALASSTNALAQRTHWDRPVLEPWEYLQSGAMPSVLARGVGRDGTGRSATSAFDPKSPPHPYRLPAFLTRLGAPVISRDLAKLRAAYKLQAELAAGGVWQKIEGFPMPGDANDNLGKLANVVRNWANVQGTFDRDDSSTIKTAITIAHMLEKTQLD